MASGYPTSVYLELWFGDSVASAGRSGPHSGRGGGKFLMPAGDRWSPDASRHWNRSPEIFDLIRLWTFPTGQEASRRAQRLARLAPPAGTCAHAIDLCLPLKPPVYLLRDCPCTKSVAIQHHYNITGAFFFSPILTMSCSDQGIWAPGRELGAGGSKPWPAHLTRSGVPASIGANMYPGAQPR